MTDIIFYEDKKGREPVREWLDSLDSGKSKDRLLLAKAYYHIELLENFGHQLKMPQSKFLKKEKIPLWELRPQPGRILYAALAYNEEGDEVFILLHHFIKKRNDTPQKEVDIAIKRYFDWIERNGKEK